MQVIECIVDTVMSALVWIMRGWRRKRATLEEIAQLFRPEDQDAAIAFYRNWLGNCPLVVSFGDGDWGEMKKDRFFSNATIYFVPPFRVGTVVVVANDSEDPMRCIAVERATGRIVCVYDLDGDVEIEDQFHIELAKSFAEFVDVVNSRAQVIRNGK